MSGGHPSRAVLARIQGWLRPPRANAQFDSKLVWIFGSPRSGSTWLLFLLAEHEAVVPINEPLIGLYLGPFMSDLPGFKASNLDRRTFTVRRLQEEKPGQFFAAQFSDVWRPQLGQLMRERFHAHASRHRSSVPLPQRLVLIKEPNGSQSADVIMSALPGSRLLFLLRDGRDVVDSDLAANLEGSWVNSEFPGSGIAAEDRHEFVVQSAHKWLWRTEVVEEAYREHTGPKRLVRYEDLLRDPHPHLREIFDWLGLEISDADLRELLARHSFDAVPDEQRGAKRFFRAATPGLWRQNLSAAEQDALEQLIGPKLRELGYA